MAPCRQASRYRRGIGLGWTCRRHVCRALPRASLFRAPAAEIARPRRVPGHRSGRTRARRRGCDLTEISAAAVAAATRHFPSRPREWLVCGGGRHNPALMAALSRRLDAPVRAVEAVGWNGDALEAQAFAYLAVRSVIGLPLSLPMTTGVPGP